MTILSVRFLAKEHLRESSAFRRAFDRKKPASDPVMIVYAVENGLGHTRIGISIGKKKVKLAVGRNRIKRLIREAFRLNKHMIPPGVDLVVVPRGPLTFDAAMRSVPSLARSAARRVGVSFPPSAST